MTETRASHPKEDAFIEEICQAFYPHHPKFYQAVRQALNIVRGHTAEMGTVVSAEDLTRNPYRNLIERIACAIHSARLERGY